MPMEYTTLGDTGMEVSRICLGCMSFGLDSSNKYAWSLNKAKSTEIIERAIDLGVTFFDTANSYSWGDSERVLGSALSDYDRDRFVIASKVFNEPMEHPHRNASGLSRKTISQEVENSLARLDIDTIDLYQIHRWDYDTPIEETLRALHDTIRRGQARYLGGSSLWAYQFSALLHTADRLGVERFVSMQNHYNPVYREEEREMLPLCATEGIGVVPWSPLAGGYLTRPDAAFDATARGTIDTDRKEERLAVYRDGGGQEINARVEELADTKDISMAQVVIAWHLHKDWVDAPIIGTSRIEHLEAAVDAIDISLTDSDVRYLEEPYEPVQVSGHR